MNNEYHLVGIGYDYETQVLISGTKDLCEAKINDVIKTKHSFAGFQIVESEKLNDFLERINNRK
jgi:hypothetical protein